MLSIVIPVYNEEENINHVLEELLNNIEPESPYEIIFVDDSSEDNTFLNIKEINSQNKKIKVLRLARRSGSHIATKAGIDASVGDKLLVISGDRQEDPSLIKDMLSNISNGFDIVWGVREARDEPFFSRIITKIFYRGLVKFTKSTTNYSVDISNADFYMISNKVINVIKESSLKNSSLFGLLAWVGFKQVSIPYKRRKRIKGSSKWGLKSKLRLAIDWYISFSPSPLRFVLYSATAIALGAVIYTIYIFLNYNNAAGIPGWASTIVLMLFFNSFIILILGLNSEYLWRTFNNTSDKPIYLIEDKIF
tara:strand:+ start:3379 stop:4299 length:921 start_codon:yes stop_codon:yes gene_type:complete